MTDPDHDGWNELLTYVLGRDLASTNFVYQSVVKTINVSGEDKQYLTLEATVRNGVTPLPQTTDNLSVWTDATLGTDVILMSDAPNGNGTRTVKYRLAIPISTMQTRKFLRLKVTQ